MRIAEWTSEQEADRLRLAELTCELAALQGQLERTAGELSDLLFRRRGTLATRESSNRILRAWALDALDAVAAFEDAQAALEVCEIERATIAARLGVAL